MKEQKAQKEQKAINENEVLEEVVDAKGVPQAPVVPAGTQVAAAMPVRGVSFDYATLMPFYSVCGLPEQFKRQCHEGDMILKRGSDVAFRLLEPGEGAVKAIVLDGQQAVLEGRPMGGELPRVWAVGRRRLDGTVLATIRDCWAAAEREAPGVRAYRFEDFSRDANPIPEHYLAEALYLRLLVQVPDSVPDAFSLVTVGGSIYVPATILFKKFDVIGVRRFFNNIQVRESARHSGEPGWKWSPAGQFVSLKMLGRSFTRANGTGGTIWTIGLERLLGSDGMIYAPSDAERDDLTRLFMGMADGEAAAPDTGDADL